MIAENKNNAKTNFVPASNERAHRALNPEVKVKETKVTYVGNDPTAIEAGANDMTTCRTVTQATHTTSHAYTIEHCHTTTTNPVHTTRKLHVSSNNSTPTPQEKLIRMEFMYQELKKEMSIVKGDLAAIRKSMQSTVEDSSVVPTPDEAINTVSVDEFLLTTEYHGQHMSNLASIWSNSKFFLVLWFRSWFCLTFVIGSLEIINYNMKYGQAQTWFFHTEYWWRIAYLLFTSLTLFLWGVYVHKFGCKEKCSCLVPEEKCQERFQKTLWIIIQFLMLAIIVTIVNLIANGIDIKAAQTSFYFYFRFCVGGVLLCFISLLITACIFEKDYVFSDKKFCAGKYEFCFD